MKTDDLPSMRRGGNEWEPLYRLDRVHVNIYCPLPAGLSGPSLIFLGLFLFSLIFLGFRMPVVLS